MVMDVINNQNDLMLNLIHSPDTIDRSANIANIIISPCVAHIIKPVLWIAFIPRE